MSRSKVIPESQVLSDGPFSQINLHMEQIEEHFTCGRWHSAKVKGHQGHRSSIVTHTREDYQVKVKHHFWHKYMLVSGHPQSGWCFFNLVWTCGETLFFKVKGNRKLQRSCNLVYLQNWQTQNPLHKPGSWVIYNHMSFRATGYSGSQVIWVITGHLGSLDIQGHGSFRVTGHSWSLGIQGY